jgi:hypothetical protein
VRDGLQADPAFGHPGAWSETILWNFGPNPDGNFPMGNLLMDASVNLYGVTGGGGSGCGTVFEPTNVNPSGQIALSAQHIQFPKTAVGGTSSYQLTIRDTGTGELMGAIATPLAPFGLSGSGSFCLAPHTQTKLTLTFTPVAASRAHQLATITCNSASRAVS